MRKLFQLLCFSLVFVFALPMASAWYIMPSAAQSFPQLTGVVEVTVQSFDQKGHAHLTTHDVLWGQGADVGDGATYACFRGSWRMFGMQEGKRYVLLLTKEGLLSEDSFFEVDSKGQITLSSFYQSWLGASSPTLNRKVFRAHLHRLAALYPFDPR